MDETKVLTKRLLMRTWKPEDYDPFFAINQEEAVYRFLGPLTREKSNMMIDRAQGNFREQGWGRWALEERDSGLLIGHCGFMPVSAESTIPAGVEIGWRLSERWQGKGLAREAAEASLRCGFKTLSFKRVLSYTTPANAASWGLMERLGMSFECEFDHPNLPDDHPLKRHVLYSLSEGDYRG